jgi:perosamine synthetase
MIRRREINLYNGEIFDILKLLFSRKFSNRSYIKDFEKKFADYIGTKHAIATYSGRGGMMLLMESLGFKRSDEIIFPAYTLSDLITLVQKRGFKPILIDIEENSFNINPNLIEEKITKKTKAIVATHMFGLPCNIKKIVEIAENYEINVIEDCCLAHGAEFQGKKVGSFGVGGFFSFHQIKLLSTFGGGMITTNDYKIEESVRKRINEFPYKNKQILKKIFSVYLEDFVLQSPLFYIFSIPFYFKSTRQAFNNLYLSFSKNTRAENSKYTNIQAFVGLKQLSNLDERIKKRIENAKLFKRLLDKNIQVQESHLNCKHTYYYFVIKTSLNSEELQRKLLSRGLDVSIKEEITDDCTNLVKEFSKECPITHDVFNFSIQVPIYESLTENKIFEIANILNEELVR